MTKKLRKLVNIILFSCLSVCSLSFSACNLFSGQQTAQELQNNENDNYATISVTINNNEFAINSGESANTRTATPVLPDKITYSLTAEGTKTGETKTTKVNFNSSVAQSDPDFIPANKYMLQLPAGTWVISVDGKNASNQSILEGTSEELQVEANGWYAMTVPVFFKLSSSGKGRVNLVIKTTGTNIHHVVISGTGQALLDKQFNVTNGEIKIYNSDSNQIPSYNYAATLTFYDSNNTIITIIKEAINIRDNIATDTWFKTGTALYLTQKNGSTNGEADFILTQEVIDILESSTFYVKGSNANSPLIKNTGNDKNDGTRYAPYSTLNAALKRVDELNNTNFSANSTNSENNKRKSFTIYCDGIIGTTDSTSKLSISPSHNLNLSIESIESTRTVEIITPQCTLAGDQTNNIALKNLTLKGNIVLKNGNLTLNSVPVLSNSADATTGTIGYFGGQLTIGGTTRFAKGISVNAVNKKIYIDSAITATAKTIIKPGQTEDGDDVSASYTEGTVILEGAGSSLDTEPYNDITAADLSKFLWENPNPLTGNNDYFSLRLKTLDGKLKGILGKTELAATNIPIWNDITFVLEGYNPSGSSTSSNPPKYEYNIQDRTDEITGTITIKMYVKKGNQKLKKGTNTVAYDSNSSIDVSLDSLSLTLYGENETPLATPGTETTITESSGGISSEYTCVTLTASNIRPGTYSLKMSAIIDSIPYSQQSAAIYASLGGS